jgi:uncharacterized protein YgfB (UPF0149 family)
MFFLFGLMLAMNNLQRYTLQPTTEEVIQEVLYNLRKLPRVNYKEVESSDEEEEEEEGEEGKGEVVQTLGRICRWSESESETEKEEGEVSEKEEGEVSEKEEGEVSEKEEEAPVNTQGLVKRRREINPVSRILDGIE